MDKKKNSFYFIGGPVAAGKSTFMRTRMFNVSDKDINFFDHNQEKLMIKLYAPDIQNYVKDIHIAKALKNALKDSLQNQKDFIIQVHFSTNQRAQINTYFHEYGHKFNMEAHFITVNDSNILKERATKRAKLGGHTSTIKSIDKTYKQAYKNFIRYIPKLKKATIWDNSKAYGINEMEPQFIYTDGILEYQHSNITAHAKELLEFAEKVLLLSDLDTCN